MSTDAREPANLNGADVLSSLPRHRPGRRTSRRPAANAGAPGTGPPEGASGSAKTGARTGVSAARGSASGTRRARPSSRGRRAATAPAPLASGARPIAIPEQGFEVEEDVRVGRALEPPSKLELATSVIELAAEAVEELVKAGVSAGSSLLKRTLELIPKP
jgi:hypothetical protein